MAVVGCVVLACVNPIDFQFKLTSWEVRFHVMGNPYIWKHFKLEDIDHTACKRVFNTLCKLWGKKKYNTFPYLALV